MKKLFVAVLMMISGFAIAQSAAPVITAAKLSHDFGEISEGMVVNHEFEITNTGNAELIIKKVTASCGCTAAAPGKSKLQPGEKTTINVRFDSEGRLGQQQKYVYILSNDPKTPELRLGFSTMILSKGDYAAKEGKIPKLVLDKNQFDFGSIEEGKVVDVKIGFKNTGNSILEIRDVKTSCGCTAALLSSRKIKPGESGSVRIEMDTAGRNGKITRTVTLYTNDPDDSNQTITLFVNIEKRKS